MDRGRRITDARTATPIRQEILDDFPQLADKVVVDVVNGMEVVDNHLRWCNKPAGSLTGRVWETITGQSDRRQQTLDRSVGSVLNGVKYWLVALQITQTKSDIAMARVAERLLETRQIVKELTAGHRDLHADMVMVEQRLDEHIERTDRQFSALQEELRLQRAEQNAKYAVTRLGSRWKRGRFDAFPPLLRAVLAANELYWGDFGTFLRLNGTGGRDAEDLCEHARDTLATLIRDVVPAEWRCPAAIEDWLAPLANAGLAADRRDVAVYLLEDSPRDVQPLAVSAAARLREPDGELPDSVPRLMLPEYLGDFVVREVERRIAAEADSDEGEHC